MVTVIISRDRSNIININPRFQSFQFRTEGKKSSINVICKVISADRDDIFNDFVMVSEISEKDAESYMTNIAKAMTEDDDVIDFSSFAV